MRAPGGVAQWECFCKLERETRIEAATFSLESRRFCGPESLASLEVVSGISTGRP